MSPFMNSNGKSTVNMHDRHEYVKSIFRNKYAFVNGTMNYKSRYVEWMNDVLYEKYIVMLLWMNGKKCNFVSAIFDHISFFYLILILRCFVTFFLPVPNFNHPSLFNFLDTFTTWLKVMVKSFEILYGGIKIHSMYLHPIFELLSH